MADRRSSTGRIWLNGQYVGEGNFRYNQPSRGWAGMDLSQIQWLKSTVVSGLADRINDNLVFRNNIIFTADFSDIEKRITGLLKQSMSASEARAWYEAHVNWYYMTMAQRRRWARRFIRNRIRGTRLSAQILS